MYVDLILNINPVIVAKHFQYRVETFFTTVFLTDVNPNGKIVYYICTAYWIPNEGQSSCPISLIWMAGCPKLSHDTKEAYMIFIDKHVQAIPDKDKDADFFEMMKNIKHMATVKRAGSI